MRVLGVVVALLVFAPAAAADVQLKVLSNRADLLSGGDALVEVSGADAQGLTVTAGSRDVSSAFAQRPDGRLQGLVTGLPDGQTVLTARAADGTGARLTLTNHAIGGPVFAGKQVQPWICATEANGLGKAADVQCNAPTITKFLYMPTGGGGLQPYDPANPPDDVATTTTDQSREVPYIVRDERGVIDRGIFDIFVLYDPSKPWAPWAPQKGWNGKVLWAYGESCAPWHIQTANTGEAQNEMALSRGFAVVSNGLNVLGNNCNTVVSAEATMMTKEHLVETYGPVRYTMGTGCSGGSIGQHMVASMYPGLLDGLQPSCTYADTTTTGNEVFDCHLLVHYFAVTSPQLWPIAAQQFATGHSTPTSCVAWDNVFGFDRVTGDPTTGCTVALLSTFYTDYTGTVGPNEPDWVYDPKTNPKGVRCTYQDYMSSVYGFRDKDGFANSPYDNVGVQYGLLALNSGEITPEQFVDLNEKIGGLTIDFGFQADRSVGDAFAIKTAYRSGQVTNGRGLADVAIVDQPAGEGEIHTAVHSWSVRERLLKANGTAGNQVIAKNGDATKVFDLLDRWLSNVEADHEPRSRAEKILRDKPANAVDTCVNSTVADPKVCHIAGTYYGGDPRMAAGGPLSADVLKCRLKKLDRRDYAASFTDDQWARLEKAFPTGVCDFAQPGVDQQPAVLWSTYADGPGGRALGEAPVSEPFAAVGGPRRLAVRAPARMRLSTLRRSGLVARVACASACTVTATLVTRAGRVVGRGGSALAAAGTARVRVRARSLRRAGRLALRVIVTQGGATRRVARSVHVQR